MSEFEMAYLMLEFLDALQSRISLFLSGLFAMLVTSYFVAAKLYRVMSGAVIALFTLYSVLIGMAIYRTTFGIRALARETIDQYGAQLAWLIGDGSTPDPTVPLLVLMVVSYIGAVWFFFYARKTAPASKA